MKALTKEVKIALVAIAGVVILFFGMNFLKGLNLFSSTNDYYIEFDDISGLSTSSPIYADGYKVGTVKSVIYDYSNEHPIRVLVGLDNQIRIPKGSSAEIESDLMGNVKVNLATEARQHPRKPKHTARRPCFGTIAAQCTDHNVKPHHIYSRAEHTDAHPQQERANNDGQGKHRS